MEAIKDFIPQHYSVKIGETYYLWFGGTCELTGTPGSEEIAISLEDGSVYRAVTLEEGETAPEGAIHLADGVIFIPAPELTYQQADDNVFDELLSECGEWRTRTETVPAYDEDGEEEGDEEVEVEYRSILFFGTRIDREDDDLETTYTFTPEP